MRLRLCALACSVPLVLTACGGDGSPVAEPSPSPVAPTPGPAPEPTTDGQPDDDPDEDADDGRTPEQAALALISAVAEGRSDDAFALLAPSSQQEIGGREGFTALETALSEGFGAFAGSEPRLLRTELDDGGVLTLAAEVQREGSQSYGTATLPYRDGDGDGALLDPFATAGGSVEFSRPARGGAVAPGAELEVFVPAATDAVVAVDGELLGDVRSEGFDGDQQRLTVAAPDDLQVDRVYVLTVVWTDDDGRRAADAIPFTTG